MSWWRRQAAPAPSDAPSSPAGAFERWIVLDVETTGLETRHADLLAIAALGVRCDWRARRLSLCLGDSLSVRLQPTQPSQDKANVLVHGIGTGRQREGMPAPEALSAFLAFAQGARLVAFHAAFDREVLERQFARHLGQRLQGEWVDIAHLCATAWPQLRARALDDWLDHFHIECLARHEAAADVLAESELLLRVWPRVARECGSWRELRKYADSHRWLPRG